LRGTSGEFAAGAITGASFSGNGASITAINATAITTGTLDNARTTAASANGASTIVARDANGSFTANVGTFTTISGAGGGISGINASNISSGTIANARTTAATANGASTIVLRGGSGEFTAGAITAVSFTGSGSGLTSIPNSATTASAANGANTIVARDASGNFTSNVITATLTGTASNATVLQTARTINGTSFNGSANITITANTTNTLTLGTGLTGTSFNGSGAVTATVSYGTTAGTACQGNDSRLSDSRQATNTNTQLASLGVGTAASGTTGEIRATNNVTAFFSDERLKTKTGNIENALDKVCQIETLLYHANETAVALGYDASIQEVGVTAQSVQKVQPEIVVPAPIDDKYLTVRYEKLVPLLIEAIKELKAEVDALKGK
jgi:hypothetical protein